MKINPRFTENENNDPYSENFSKKVTKIENIEDLSPDALERLELLREKFVNMCSHQGQIGDPDPLISLMSFQAFQIECLQHSTFSLQEINFHLAKRLDELIDDSSIN